MSKISIAEILGLSVPTRIGLIALLLESFATAPQAPVVDEQLKAELEERLREFESNPEAGYAWEQVKSRLRDGTWRSA